MELLQELGYSLDAEKLSQQFKQYTGNEISEGSKKWYEAAAPYFVMAYKAGIENKPLSGIFPFLVKNA